MKVEIWADVVCPWCGIGTHRFHEALRQFDHADEVEIVHRSFQLDPSLPQGRSMSSAEALAQKGYPEDQLEAMMQRVEGIAAADGLQPYRVGTARMGSTALIHQVLTFAREMGLGEDAWQAVYARHFGDNDDIFTMDGVLEFAEEIGLDADETEAVLLDGRYAQTVIDDQAEAQALGATGVPFFVVDRRYGIAGAQGSDAILDVLNAAWAETHTVDEAQQ